MGTRLRRPLVALAIISALLPCLAARRAADPERPREDGPASRDAFEDADLAFRDLYSHGRAATLSRLGPLIVIEMDDLVLLRDGQRTVVKVIPPLYHRLKSVSHVPLALYVALAPYGDAPLDDDRLTRLRAFRARVMGISAALERAGFSPDQVTRSRELLQRCTGFLDGVLTERKYVYAALKSLTRESAPVVLANADDAARLQIDACHAQVSAWRRQLPRDEWSRLRVLVLGHPMPRKRNVAVQYFAKLLGVPGESRRLVYAEELGGEQQGLDLLATHQLDGELSEAFFGDPERMEIDLLGNAASVYLDGFDFDR
jgi:hypothetical protein